MVSILSQKGNNFSPSICRADNMLPELFLIKAVNALFFFLTFKVCIFFKKNVFLEGTPFESLQWNSPFSNTVIRSQFQNLLYLPSRNITHSCVVYMVCRNIFWNIALQWKISVLKFAKLLYPLVLILHAIASARGSSDKLYRYID
jgi:hypothetical protein